MMKLPRIALGAWAWGNDGTFGNEHTAEELKPVFDVAMENGLNLWDTAYAYGMGTSENILAGFLRGLPRSSYLISDKFTPQCVDNDSPDEMGKMIQMQLELMGLDQFDIYWIHNVVNAPNWTKALAEYYDGKDRVPMIGVSNHNLAEIKEANEILRSHGLKLSAVQNHYSLLCRSSESSGILDYCKDNDITFFAYMVLEQGALTGKYDEDHPFPEKTGRGVSYNPYLKNIASLNEVLDQIGKKYNASIAQIATAWAISKGTIPIIGVTKVYQVEEAYNSTKVNLSSADIEMIESAAEKVGISTLREWEKEMI